MQTENALEMGRMGKLRSGGDGLRASQAVRSRRSKTSG